MSVQQLEAQVLALPLAERRAFTRWLDDHRDEIEQPSTLSGGQQAEVKQRLAEMESDPSLRLPVTEADVEQMFHDFAHARGQTTPSAAR